MFREPTVLILGAGASAPYGFPLGNSLISNIQNGLQEIADDHEFICGGRSREANFTAGSYLEIKRWFLNKPNDLINEGFLSSGVRELCLDLENGPPSIDEFARINPKWRQHAKFFTTFEIAQRCYTAERNGIVRDRSLFSSAEHNWYASLIHELRRGARNARDLAENKLFVITFNYDRSLEWYFEMELSRGQIFSGFDMKEAPSVLHLHGEIELLPAPFPGQAIPMLEAWSVLSGASDRFVMLDEDRSGHIQTPQVAELNLDRAQRIFVLGYDFHEQNNELINLANNAHKCVVLNWNGNHRVRRRAIDLGVPEDSIFSGDKREKLEIKSAIDDDGLFSFRP